MPASNPLVHTALAPALLASLRAQARTAAANAYAPYSHFRVGAALLLAAPNAGQIITGCNVENASFRLTTCAEQTAIATAVAQFGPAIRLVAVAVANLNDAASMPCGACRQTLLEFAPDSTAVLILYPGENGCDATATLADLLPAAFRLLRT